MRNKRKKHFLFKLKRYLFIFKVSFQQEIVYRVNFLMWRVRNVIQIFLVFFLWDSVFQDSSREIFGYDRDKMLTYVFGLILVKALVFSSKSMQVSREVSRGDLNNSLLKPINYFFYWLTRDVASKFLNISFAIVETLILLLILKPPFFIQTNPIYLLSFAISVSFSMLIFFNIIFLTSSIPFWMPEAAWGAHFLITTIVTEFLSGALFPLDILPKGFLEALSLTPFPYMVFFPLQLYLGKLSSQEVLKGMSISFIWLIVLFFVTRYVWRKGLKVYEAYGR